VTLPRLVRIWRENDILTDTEPPTHSARHAKKPGLGPRPVTSLSIRSAERRRWSADLISPEVSGLVLYGVGGIGKSTLAAQIAARVSRLQPGRAVTVINGEVRAADLAAHGGLLVLDNFDDNLSADADLRDPALTSLLADWAGPLLITCRRRFSLPRPGLAFRHLGPLTRTGAAELALSLPALRLAEEPERDHAWRLTGGHPRAIEYLDSLLAFGDVRFQDVASVIVAAVRARTGQPVAGADPTELPEDTAETIALAAGDQLLGELFGRLSAAAQAVLIRASVFRAPAAPGTLTARSAEIAECLAAGLLTAGPGGEVWVHRWTADELHRRLAQTGRVAAAHRLAAWHWESVAGSGRAPLEARYHRERASSDRAGRAPRVGSRRKGDTERRGPGLAWLAAVTVAVVVLLAADAAGASSGSPAARSAGTMPLAQAATVRDQAAAWVAGQVSPGAVFACDPAMCSALARHGVAAGSLLVLRPGAPDPLGADVVLATAAARGLFGSRLASVYAPDVLASFGADATRIEVRAVAPDGAAAYQTALAADQRARLLAGRQLLRNTRIGLSPSARSALAAGRVDARLLVTLAALATLAPDEPVRILAFGDSGPGASPDMPLRAAELTVADAPEVLAFVRAQRPPYLPARASAHGTVLSVEFVAPSPTGLLQTQPLPT
jgi:hypothetical protein